VPRSSVCTW